MNKTAYSSSTFTHAWYLTRGISGEAENAYWLLYASQNMEQIHCAILRSQRNLQSSFIYLSTAILGNNGRIMDAFVNAIIIIFQQIIYCLQKELTSRTEFA